MPVIVLSQADANNEHYQLQRQLDTLTAKVAALEEGGQPGTTPAGTDSYDHYFFDGTESAHANDMMWDIATNRDGGRVLFDGRMHADGIPFIIPPGLEVNCVGYPNAWSKSRTRFIREWSSDDDTPVIDFTDRGQYDEQYGSGREAWGGARVTNMQVDPNGHRGAAVRTVGGNVASVDTLRVIGVCTDGWVIDRDEGRNYDGQYSIYRNFTVRRYTGHGIRAERGAPDIVWEHGFVYGNSTPGTTGIETMSGSGTSASANNQTFLNFHSQFSERPLVFDSDECIYIGGSVENKSGMNRISPDAVAVTLGAGLRWFNMVGTSFANKSSWDRMFELDPDADRYLFTGLTGINESDIAHLSTAQRAAFTVPPNQ